MTQADINTDGSLSTWQSSNTNLPLAIYWHSSTTNNNNIYILGGTTYPPPLSVDKVYLGTISNGLVTSWTEIFHLPDKFSMGAAVAVNDKLYFAGGFRLVGGSSTPSNKVYMAEINPDGTIGPWTETTPLPVPLNGFGMIETGNKVIVIGGASDLGLSDKAWEAEILPSGHLGSWSLTYPLPGGAYRPGVTKIGNLVVSVGGDNSGGPSDKVHYTTIDASGSIGTWQESSNNFPKVICCGALSASDTHLYYTGGHNTQTAEYFNTTYVAALEEQDPGLNVPDIKQYSSPWNDDIYNNATVWSSNPTIERWGCALTSATMVLSYHGHNINPDTLNDWLISQSDGYTRNGGVMWTAISRYTKINSNETKPTLEFSYHPPDINFLSSEIENERPPILKYQNQSNLATHFVVAKGKTDSDFNVNDPGSNTNTLASEVEAERGQLVKIGKFSPSQTDLSYIVLMVDGGFTLKVYDPDGQEITEGYLTEGPIVDAVNNTDTNGIILNAFYLPKPTAGFYKVEIAGEGNFQLDSYLYDKDGNLNLAEHTGALGDMGTDNFLINFDQENSNNSNISEVSFDSILKDLKTAHKNHKIKRGSVYRIFKRLIASAKRHHARGRISIAKRMLTLTNKYLSLFTPRFIEPDTSAYLKTKITILRNSF